MRHCHFQIETFIYLDTGNFILQHGLKEKCKN